nr:hypothetical protein Itr_chr02CG10900 [Ipomoea trifida]
MPSWKGPFALPPECSASPGKGRTGGAIVGAATVAPFLAELRRRRNNPPPSPSVAVKPLDEREKGRETGVIRPENQWNIVKKGKKIRLNFVELTKLSLI